MPERKLPAHVDASFRLFPDTHHSFDRETPVELVPDASVSPGSPTIYIRADGALVRSVTGKPDPGFAVHGGPRTRFQWRGPPQPA